MVSCTHTSVQTLQKDKSSDSGMKNQVRLVKYPTIQTRYN